MATASVQVEIRTHGKAEVVNVTASVRQALKNSSIRCGIAVIGTPHTTCGVCVNEDEDGLKDDLVRLAEHLLDSLEGQDGFRHDRVDDNARSHLTSILVGQSVTVPVVDGELRLGTWQSVLLLEMDGPRSRRLDLTFVGE